MNTQPPVPGGHIDFRSGATSEQLPNPDVGVDSNGSMQERESDAPRPIEQIVDAPNMATIAEDTPVATPTGSTEPVMTSPAPATTVAEVYVQSSAPGSLSTLEGLVGR